MPDPIKHVQNDSGPALRGTLIDLATNLPLDVSNAGTTVRYKVRKKPAGTVTTFIATKPNGGADGVVSVAFTTGTFTEAGIHEGEFEITFNTGVVQSVFDKILHEVREGIG
jgi:hypothetical protein